MVANAFFIIACIVGIIFAGVSCLLGIYVRKKVIKYIPAGVAGIATLLCFMKAFYFSKGFEGLGYIVYAMILAVAFVTALVTAVVMEFMVRRN